MGDKRQTEKAGARRGAARAFFPYLFAVFPVVSILSSNAGKVPLYLAAKPIFIALVLTASASLLLRPILSDAHKRGAVLLLAVALFWSFGALVGAVRQFVQPGAAFSIAQRVFFVIAIALPGFYAVHRIRKSSHSFAPLSRFLNAMSLATLGAAAAWLAVNSMGSGAAPLVLEMESANPAGGNRPNIVYIVLDAYTRADLLEDAYGFDNSSFIQALEDRGFFVAGESYANYNMTTYSLASTLNLQLLNGLAIRLGGDARPESLLGESLVIEQLRERGYHTVAFRSDTTEALRGKVDSFIEPDRSIHEFHARLIEATPIRLIADRLNARRQEQHGRRALLYDIHRDGVREKFERLESMAFGETPHFVFAHILSPHWPFVFGANGEAVYPAVRYRLDMNFPSWEGPTLDEFTTGYAAQLQAVNAMTLRTLDGLLEKNPNTIVVLQGDHGTRRSMLSDEAFPLEDRAREEHAILNAFRFPGGDPPAAIGPAISSVNTFRVIFDELFGANLGLVEPEFFMFDPTEEEVDHDVTQIIRRALGR